MTKGHKRSESEGRKVTEGVRVMAQRELQREIEKVEREREQQGRSLQVLEPGVGKCLFLLWSPPLFVPNADAFDLKVHWDPANQAPVPVLSP